MQPRGCPYGDVAPDWKLSDQARAFVQAEVLAESPGYARVQERLLGESGLAAESAETILELRGILTRYRDEAAKRGGDGR